ncbi:hypothetical protein GRX01_04275 [Halobaculum sp. WSA2]|uniref:Uncharacterized protein n=1 Tax=Halobaculum saliterrae TaxID=2073113 RepID=A0A6B0SNT2_9EURY|nr:hypothetical protein [Halobaculum saliterrae]MXR40564.1 hypothetical protein [Halobaculum saliterrae]
MTDDNPDTDTDDPTAPGGSAVADDSRPPGDPAGTDSADPDEDIDRRRLIRWIAVLAFAVPVVVEVLTFGGLLGNTLIPGGGEESSEDGSAASTTSSRDDGVGIGDELLPEAPPVETVEVSEVRGESADSRTYVLRVAVENTTDGPVELRLAGVTLRDGRSLESVSTTGSIPAGGTGEVTGAWGLPTDSMPVSVDAVLLRDGTESIARSVPLKRPPIRG